MRFEFREANKYIYIHIHNTHKNQSYIRLSIFVSFREVSFDTLSRCLDKSRRICISFSTSCLAEILLPILNRYLFCLCTQSIRSHSSFLRICIFKVFKSIKLVPLYDEFTCLLLVTSDCLIEGKFVRTKIDVCGEILPESFEEY